MKKKINILLGLMCIVLVVLYAAVRVVFYPDACGSSFDVVIVTAFLLAVAYLVLREGREK